MVSKTAAKSKVSIATRSDSLRILEFCQRKELSKSSFPATTHLADIEALLSDGQHLCLLTCDGKTINGFLCAALDREQGLAKLHGLVLPRDNEDEILKTLFRHASECLKETEKLIDIFYSTTRALSLRQQSLTLEMGATLLGIFPTARVADETRLNGLAAFYLNDSLTKKRAKSIKIHPALEHYVNIVSEQLPEISYSLATLKKSATSTNKELDLEIIEAKNFVMTKFEECKKRRFLASNFYPFQTPNALLVDSFHKAEIYVRLYPEQRFATIIAEHLETSIEPASLFRSVCYALEQRGYSFIEVVNDAEDVIGTQAMLEAGFLPCCFIPGFKRHRDQRRDYFVLAYITERLLLTGAEVPPRYAQFLEAYYSFAKIWALPQLK